MDMLERAKFALNTKTDKDFCNKLGISQSTITGYKNRGNVPQEQCIKIAKMTGVDLNWLILGEGISPTGQYVSNPENDQNFISIPLYDITASAGNGCTFDNELIISELSFRQDWLRDAGLHQKDLVCLGIRGDSMEPTLKSGDTILVNRAKKSGDGIFVIRIGEQLRVKRLQWLIDGNIKVISDNPVYDPETINPCEIDGFFEIIGACHTKIGLIQ